MCSQFSRITPNIISDRAHFVRQSHNTFFVSILRVRLTIWRCIADTLGTCTNATPSTSPRPRNKARGGARNVREIQWDQRSTSEISTLANASSTRSSHISTTLCYAQRRFMWTRYSYALTCSLLSARPRLDSDETKLDHTHRSRWKWWQKN